MKMCIWKCKSMRIYILTILFSYVISIANQLEFKRTVASDACRTWFKYSFLVTKQPSHQWFFKRCNIIHTVHISLWRMINDYLIRYCQYWRILHRNLLPIHFFFYIWNKKSIVDYIMHHVVNKTKYVYIREWWVQIERSVSARWEHM